MVKNFIDTVKRKCEKCNYNKSNMKFIKINNVTNLKFRCIKCNDIKLVQTGK